MRAFYYMPGIAKSDPRGRLGSTDWIKNREFNLYLYKGKVFTDAKEFNEAAETVYADIAHSGFVLPPRPFICPEAPEVRSQKPDEPTPMIPKHAMSTEEADRLLATVPPHELAQMTPEPEPPAAPLVTPDGLYIATVPGGFAIQSIKTGRDALYRGKKNAWVNHPEVKDPFTDIADATLAAQNLLKPQPKKTNLPKPAKKKAKAEAGTRNTAHEPTTS